MREFRGTSCGELGQEGAVEERGRRKLREKGDRG